MEIYKKVTRYDQVTGKPIEKKAFHELRCDFTGEVIEHESIYCRYNLDYDYSDPCCGAGGDEYEFGKEFNIEVHTFLLQQYHFISVGGSDAVEDYAEAMMMKEALANCNKKKSPWYRCFTFDAMCRTARILTARKLIKEGVITPDQLDRETYGP